MRQAPIAKLDASTPLPEVVRYGFRSLDRAWLILDNRLASRSRPALWVVNGEHEVYLTIMLTDVLGQGPSALASAAVPDRHHFCGRGGKDFIPLWRDAEATSPNLPAALLGQIAVRLGKVVSAPDLFAYTYGILSATAFAERFAEELTLPPLHLPITTDALLFEAVAAQGRHLLWLHTYGTRFVPEGQRKGRLPAGKARWSQPVHATELPESFEWVPAAGGGASGALRVGSGRLEPVSFEAWSFSVSSYEVLKSWLEFRMKNRSGSKSSELDDIRPTAWDAALSQELQELVWVLEATVEAQPVPAELLSDVLQGSLFHANELTAPTAAERAAPGDDEEGPAQAMLI